MQRVGISGVGVVTHTSMQGWSIAACRSIHAMVVTRVIHALHLNIQPEYPKRSNVKIHTVSQVHIYTCVRGPDSIHLAVGGSRVDMHFDSLSLTPTHTHSCTHTTYPIISICILDSTPLARGWPRAWAYPGVSNCPPVEVYRLEPS